MKALYRKGVAYTKMNELDKAKECLNQVATIDPTMSGTVKSALQEVKSIDIKNKKKEKEVSKKMIEGVKYKTKEN